MIHKNKKLYIWRIKNGKVCNLDVYFETEILNTNIKDSLYQLYPPGAISEFQVFLNILFSQKETRIRQSHGQRGKN